MQEFRIARWVQADRKATVTLVVKIGYWSMQKIKAKSTLSRTLK